jgi:hypothetical protein
MLVYKLFVKHNLNNYLKMRNTLSEGLSSWTVERVEPLHAIKMSR